MKQSILALAVFIVAGVPGIAVGQTASDVYSNRFVGLTFPVPAGWYVATDSETKGLLPQAAKVMRLDDPAAKAVVGQMPGKVLLMVSERPFSSDVQSVNPNIIVAAISAREIKNEISSGSDYLTHVARGMKESQPSATVSDITIQRLGGQEFHGLGVTFPIQGITAHMNQLARIHNEYLVIVNMTAESEAGLKRLVEFADGVQMSAVPPTVDKSPEGEAFRKQATPQIPQPSSGGSAFLKNAGLILMFFGAYWLLRGLFRKK